MLSLFFLFILGFCKSSPEEQKTINKDELSENTRRIIWGQTVKENRPYMVYLRPILTVENREDVNWLCGGVIIQANFILTSAACIEDTTYFYVVSGTYDWVPPDKTTECIENGAMRAIWRCMPRTYRYDGNSFNNIKWMVNDIAVVMTESSFDFTRRVKGCDFIPMMVAFNNISQDEEKPGTKATIIGWGSDDAFVEVEDVLVNKTFNAPTLKEADTVIIPKERCKTKWHPRYHAIIDKYMICGKSLHRDSMSQDCNDMHVQCRELILEEEEGPRSRRFEGDPDKLLLYSAAYVREKQKTRRMIKKLGTRRLDPLHPTGGVCENDHGGPLLVGRGRNVLIVGIISAYRVKEQSTKCFGPFLFTSVYNNRHLIHCAVNKKTDADPCSMVLRGSSTILEEQEVDWGKIPTKDFKYDEEESHVETRTSSQPAIDTDTDTDMKKHDPVSERTASELKTIKTK